METTMHMKNVKTMEGTEITDNYGVKKGKYKNGKTPKNKKICNTQDNLKTTD